jgi:hypothetical protein
METSLEIMTNIYLLMMPFGLFIVLAYSIYAYFKKNKYNPQEEQNVYLYNAELYLENGELFKQYSNVYVTHWDNNIYIFKNESLNELVHKSENITLIRRKIA